MRRAARIVALTFACISAAACAVDADPAYDFYDQVGPTRVRVTEISVEETEFLGYLEIEVHLYDADTGERLGCTGEQQGLEGVDNPGRSYIVLSDFVVAGSRQPLLFDDIASRNIVIEVTERDYEGDSVTDCPSPPGPEDDMVGVSDPMPATDLDPALETQFGDVTHLVIGTSRTRL